MPVTSPALVAPMWPIVRAGHLPVAHSAAAGPSTTTHPFSSVQVFAQHSASPLAWAQVSDQVMAICKEHATVNANVVPSIHFAISTRAAAPQALSGATRSRRSVDQLVIKKVVFFTESLATYTTNQQTGLTTLLPPPPLTYRRKGGGRSGTVVHAMAA